MKRRSLIYAFLLLLSAFTLSCKKDADVNIDTFKIEKENVVPSTQSVKITGTYAYSGTVDAITLELGRQADLKDSDEYRTLIENKGFSVEVKNLRSNTTYYYRYAVEYGGKAPYYTGIKSFNTLEYNLPEVKSNEVVSVGVNRAEVSGEVISDGGGDAVTLRGICWSTNHNPSVGDEYANSGEGIGAFTCELTNLQPEKTYYARAFAGNSKGVAYGEELTFITLAAGSLAEVSTIGITGNAMLQATVQGEVTNEGTSAVIERGICYGKEHYPTTSGLHVASGSGAGEYTCQLTNLEANTTYYVRAYAINSLGIAYGEEKDFVAQTETTVPVVTTGMVSDITASSATGRGTVMSDGGATVTRRGLCWGTAHNPTADGTHADCGSGVGEFSGLMPHLTDLTTYYVRAYAENSVGMAYGEEVSFTVGQHFQQYTVAVSADPTTGGTVSGGGTYQQGGTCMVTATANNGYTFTNWTENSSVVSTNASYTFTVTGDRNLVAHFGINTYTISVSADPSAGGTVSGGGSFQQGQSCTVTATANSGYTFTNWTENGGEVSTETNYSFVVNEDRTLVAHFALQTSLPTVTTSSVTNITETTATGGGNVTSDGNATVTERGVCWSTSPNPTTSDSHASSGTGTGAFTVNMMGLSPGTTYYVRAYAINSVGTGYGNEVSFAIPGTLLIDFETGDLANYNFNNTMSSYPWVIWSSNPHAGTYCMASSGNGVSNAYSVIELTLYFVTDGTVSFYSRISCEDNWDYGYFYIDDIQKLSQKGDSSWAVHSFTVTAGSHTFRWAYVKDSSVNSGEDRYFIDDIEFNGVVFDK